MRKHFILLLPAVTLLVSAIISCQPETPINYPEGGYDYPATVSDSNYYFYPLQKTFLRRDSFRLGMLNYAYHAFNEPNLSIAPGNEDVFRLYFEGWKQLPAVITLTRNQIVVKRGISSRDLYEENTARLTELERFHYSYLQYRYPVEERYATGSWAKRHADSLIKVYPQLVSPAYFKYLSEKARKQPEKPFKYAVIKKSISYKEYYRLVAFINSVGYWKMPYQIECDAEVSDGDGYILEARTQRKYNFVRAYSCPDDKTGFTHICQEIINSAGLGKDIQLLPDSTKIPATVLITDVVIENIKEPAKKDSVPAQQNKKRKK